MIDATIESDHAVIHVVSGVLDVTYEVKASELWRRTRSYYGQRYVRTGKTGFVLDLAEATRDPKLDQPPYIFGCMEFETAVRRALSKARHLERVWFGTSTRKEQVAA